MDGAHGVFAAAAQGPDLLVARRIGQDGQVAVGVGPAADGLRRIVDRDAGVDRDGAKFVHDDRVNVHLAQLGQLADHFRDAQQNLLQCIHVHRRSATPCAQGFGHARAPDQLAGQELVERRQLHGPVVDQLDHGAACAEGNHRAERVVGHQANAHLAAASGPRHGLHRDAVDARMGLEARNGLHHLGVGVAHAGGVQDVERHAFNVGLVADVGRVDLQRHRIAQLRGDHHRLVGGARQNGLRDRDVERRQQRLGLHLGQHLAALGQHMLDDQSRALDVGLGQRGQRRRRLLKQLLVLVEGRNVAKGADGRFRRAKSWNCRVVQNAAPRHHRRIAHPARQQRLAHAALDLGQGACHLGGINALLRRENR